MRCNSLTSKQKEAIDYLSRGWNSTETCEFLKIHPSTLCRWKLQTTFKTELDKRINKQKQVVSDRIIELIDRSKDVLLEALESREKKMPGYVKVALEILKTYKPPIEEPKKEKQLSLGEQLEKVFGNKSTQTNDEDVVLSAEDLDRMLDTSRNDTQQKQNKDKQFEDYSI